MKTKTIIFLTNIFVFFAIITFVLFSFLITQSVINTSEILRDKESPTLEAIHNMRFGIARIVSSTNELLVISASYQNASQEEKAESSELELIAQGATIYQDAYNVLKRNDKFLNSKDNHHHTSLQQLQQQYNQFFSIVRKLSDAAKQDFDPVLVSELKENFEYQEMAILLMIQQFLTEHRSSAKSSIDNIIYDVYRQGNRTILFGVMMTVFFLAYFVFIQRLFKKIHDLLEKSEPPSKAKS